MRLGMAHHFGWAVVVTASRDHTVVDRRRIELIEPGLPAALIHVGGPHELHRPEAPLDDDALAALVAQVRSSVVRVSSASLDDLAAAGSEPIESMSLRSWPADFPTDIGVQRRVPYESRADSVMYRQVLAEVAGARGWDVCFYDANRVEAEAARLLGDRADEVLPHRGRRWAHRGARTTGWRSRPRSWHMARADRHTVSARTVGIWPAHRPDFETVPAGGPACRRCLLRPTVTEAAPARAEV